MIKTHHGTWEDFGKILPSSRHTSVLVKDDQIYIFYSVVGECPEHIRATKICHLEKDNIQVRDTCSVLKPEREFEHGNVSATASKYGAAYNNVHQLRDPYLFEENGTLYMLYTVCGEKGIALATCNSIFS
jgi:hypothetical protein